MSSGDGKPTDVLGLAPYGETLKVVAQGGMDGAGALLGKLLLPAAEEAGLALRDLVAQRRARRLHRIEAEALRQLEAAKEEPREVAESTLEPLLLGAGSTDEPELVTLWTNLLANAASPSADDVPPLLPHILKQLTARDAMVLQRFQTISKAGDFVTTVRTANHASAKFGGLGSFSQIELSLASLAAVGLLRISEPILEPVDRQATAHSAKSYLAASIPKRSGPTRYDLTALGDLMLKSVRPRPQAAASSEA